MMRLLLPLSCALLVQGIIPAQDTSDLLAIRQDTAILQGSPDGSMTLLWKPGSSTQVPDLLAISALSYEALVQLNPILLFRDPVPTDLLILPYDENRFMDTRHQAAIPLWYRVGMGETAFSIARRRFNISLDTFMMMNAMMTPDLRQGQLVRIGWYLPDAKNTTTSKEVGGYALGGEWVYVPGSDSSLLVAETDVTYTRQRGVALWNKSKPDPNLFAMHRDAPVGSLIRITNPMFGRTVLAKVIGTIPPTYPDDIEIIVSEGVARQLGAIDSRFYAEVSYAIR